MLDTFRKRDAARNQPRPVGLAPLAAQAKTAEAPQHGEQTALQRTITERTVPLPSDVQPIQVPVTPREHKPAPERDASGPEGRARLTVGAEIKLQGAQISDCDTLLVEGQVDACMDSRVIIVAEQGTFRGTVHVDIAEIRGRFEGELSARSQLMIRASGKVTGTVRYGKLLVEEGGELAGDVAAQTSTDGETHARPAIAAAVHRGAEQ